MVHQFPLNQERVTQIPIDQSLDFYTHSARGEHARKESAAWQVFLDRLTESGGSLPSDIDDPFAYYLAESKGDFYKASFQHQDEWVKLISGMAVSHTADKGLTVDALYAPQPQDLAETGALDLDFANSLIASSIYRLLTRSVFDQYDGAEYPDFRTPAARYFDLTFGGIGHILQPDSRNGSNEINFSLLRSIADFAIPVETGFRIPLPNRVIANIKSPEALADAKSEELGKGFDGGFSFVDAVSNTTIEEFYRDGTHIGSTKITHGGIGVPRTVTAFNYQGVEIELPGFSSLPKNASTHRVRFLKLLAENDPQAAELLLS